MGPPISAEEYSSEEIEKYGIKYKKLKFKSCTLYHNVKYFNYNKGSNAYTYTTNFSQKKA